MSPPGAPSGPLEPADGSGEPLALFGAEGLVCARCEAFRCRWRNPRGTRYDCAHDDDIALGHLLGDHRFCQPDECDWAAQWREALLAYAVEHADPDRPLLVVTIRTGRIVSVSRHESYRTAGPARTGAGRLPEDDRRNLMVAKGRALVLCADGNHLH